MPDAPTTLAEALEKAIRLLEAAEDQTDRQLMEGLTRLAEGWTAVAGLLHDTE